MRWRWEQPGWNFRERRGILLLWLLLSCFFAAGATTRKRVRGSFPWIENKRMKKKIEIASWPRRSHYEYFRTFDCPSFSITSPVRVDALYRYAKQEGISFFILCLFVLLNVMGNVPKLKWCIILSFWTKWRSCLHLLYVCRFFAKFRMTVLSAFWHTFICKMIEVMMKAGYPFCSTSSFSGAPGSSRSVGFRGLK